MGNLWVWPGSHNVAASYLREHGPTRCSISNTDLPNGVARTGLGRAGDLFLWKLLARPQHGETLLRWSRRDRLFPSSSGRPSTRWRDCVRIRCWNLSLHEWLLTALGDYLSERAGHWLALPQIGLWSRRLHGSNFCQGGSGPLIDSSATDRSEAGTLGRRRLASSPGRNAQTTRSPSSNPSDYAA